MERQHLVGVAALLLMGCSTGKSRAEELGCFKYSKPRTVEICRAVAEEMEFKLMGHAVPAPGYKATRETSVRVYCRLGLSKRDEAAIREFRDEFNTSKDLLELVGAAPAGATSIFNPEHPSYVLKTGCPGR